MKKSFPLLAITIFFLLSLSSQVYGQVAGSFDIFIMKWRFGASAEEYLANNGFKTGSRVMMESTIVYPDDKSRVNLESVREFLTKNYPSTTSTGYLFMNWESGPYLAMKKYPVTDSRFKAAESEILKLINEVKKLRPYIKITMYQMPYRFWYANQNELYNGVGKFDNIFPKLDFIAPSYYILKPDEEVGEARNLQYLRENLDVALAYGKKFNKPVIPFVWHKIHPNESVNYAGEIMQKEAFAKYIKYIASYSFNNYKAAGVWWYDSLSDQLKDVSGINNCLNGTVYDKATYDAMIVNYAKHVKQVLNESLTTPPATATQQVVSYTLVDAITGKDIQTLSGGATLNLATLPSKNLNIRATTNPSTVGSVVFALTGAQSKSVTESTAPYDLMGDYGTWTPAVGNYTLKATPYTASKGSGTAGTALSVAFSVINQVTSTDLISNIVASSGRSYKLASLAVGTKTYTDRTNQVTSVPSSLSGSSLIQTANDDKKYTGSTQLTFTLSQTSTVYIAYDPRATTLPYWLSGWQKVTDRVGVNDSKISYMTLYSKSVPAGKVSIGGNMQSPAKGAENNFFVLVQGGFATTSAVANIVSTSAASGLEDGTLDLSVYPNPNTGDKIYIRLNGYKRSEAVTITMQDILGRVIHSGQLITDEQGTAHAHLSLDRKPGRGIYILEANAASGKTQAKLLIE
jgi:hypothetical protein